MKKKKNFICMLAAALVVAAAGKVPQNAAGADGGNSLKDTSFRRVVTENNNGLLRYVYQDAAGAPVEIQPSDDTTSVQKALLRKRENIPAKYDPRGTKQETPIRDQMDTGACWTFGAMKSLEGNMISQGLYEPEEADFSENHLAWYAYHPLKDKLNPLYGDGIEFETAFGRTSSDAEIYSFGGNAIYATFILANKWGAVSEKAAPFANASVMAEAMAGQAEDFRWQSEVQMTDAICYDYAGQEAIKKEIMQNGAMEVSLYYPENSSEKKKYLYETDGLASLYQNKMSPEEANHCAAIVGWDDDFDTFNISPTSKGAWLIANSYGTDNNDNGYLWVSYEDTALSEFYSFHGVPADTYETAYQYDGFGWNEGIISDQDVAAANIFSNGEKTPQLLMAAGFYTVADGQDYEINIYRNLGNGGPTDGEWVERCTISGTEDYSGYHTVELAEPIAVAPGEKFSVIVSFPAGGKKAYAVLEGESEELFDFNYCYYGRKGESYLFLKEDNLWYDTVEESVNNVCVKAFAKAITQEAYEEQEKGYKPSEGGEFPWSDAPTPTPSPTPVPTVSPVRSVSPRKTAAPAKTSANNRVTKISGSSKLVLGKGERAALPVKTVPASGKATLKYRSSNKAVVSVNASGVIRAKKVGKAKITVTAPSGVKKQIQIRVKKAPKSVKLTVGKTVLKSGKTTKLKVTLSKNSASYALKYSSRNKKTASVSSAGKVRAKQAGTAKIQVKTYNNKKADIKIKVVP